MDNKINVAVIGVGRMGQYHVGAYSEMADINVVGVVDLNEELGKTVAAKYRTTYYKDYRELFGKVDICSVAAPTALHHEITIDLLKAGIHVLVEKPISHRLDLAEEMFAVAEKNNVALHVGHVERFNGAVQELTKVVHNPFFIESRRMGPFDPRIKDAGVVLDLMIHDIDIILNLVKSPLVSMNAIGASVFTDREDIVNVQMLFENGAMASIMASRVTQEKIRTMAISQEQEYIFLDYTNQDILVHRRVSSQHELTRQELKYRQESLIERIFVHRDNPLKLELRHIIDCVVNGAVRRTSPENELQSLKVALQVLDQIDLVRRQPVGA
jgi:predicted dehydrogenase